MIVDTIVHAGEPPAGYLGDPVTMEHLLSLLDEAGVDQLIQVTPATSGYDNSYSLKAAADHPGRVSVVARIDPTGPAMEQRLHQIFDHPQVIGVRITSLPASDFAKEMTSSAVAPVDDPILQQFWDVAAELVIPVQVFAPLQFNGLLTVARSHPKLPLMLDHVGMPWGAKDAFRHWSSLFDLVPAENVFIKVTGMPSLTRERYPFLRAAGYMRDVYSAFGPARMLWGSNFPSGRELHSYRESVDFVRQACDFMSAADQDQILGGTAQHVFGLGAS